MKTLLTAAIVGTVLTAAGSVAMAEEEPVTVTWFASRPVDGAIDLAIREIAKQYSDEHGGNWQLEVITEADRPSYLQKLQTLVSGGNMPDIIDIDATPYCQELVDAGMLVDVKEYLNEEGLYDSFEPTALAYQEFTNGTMYTLPLEYHVEMIWYNKEIFAENGLEVPTTMDEWLNVCQALSEAGITPIAVDGVDRWPVIRYLAMMPFRETGNEYIISLSEGNASMGDETGRNGIEFFQQIGQYFQEGFAATDYATAQANEFCVNSGIGMAFNSETFDEKTKDFINYVIENYGKIYAGMDQMTPIKSELPEDHEFSELYLQVREDMSNIGEHFLKPWDCYLDSNTCNVVNDNALLLATGDMDADTFIELVDSALAEYTSGF